MNGKAVATEVATVGNGLEIVVLRQGNHVFWCNKNIEMLHGYQHQLSTNADGTAGGPVSIDGVA